MKDSFYEPPKGWQPIVPVTKWPLLGVELEVEIERTEEYYDWEAEGCNCSACRCDYQVERARRNPSISAPPRETLDKTLEEKYKDWLVTKADGSLNNGIELVSVPMPFEEHRKRWPRVLTLLAKNNVNYNEGTGLHVHIETPELPPRRTNTVLQYNQNLIQAIAGRTDTEYCEWPYEDDGSINDDHYGVINYTEFKPRVSPTNIVYEFRASQATTDLKEFLGRVQLPVAITEFILKTDLPVKQLEKHFKQYPYIKALI